MVNRFNVITNLYWRLLEEVKYHERYCYYALKKTTKIVTILEVIQIFASCGFVASWTIWENLEYVWAAILTLSQLINIFKSYIPFYKRKSNLQKAYIQLSTLCQHIEYDWNGYFLKITDKNMITNDICDSFNSLYEKYHSDFQKIINDDPNDFLNQDDTIERMAKSETKNFLQKFS